jgi:hypothetical protein
MPDDRLTAFAAFIAPLTNSNVNRRAEMAHTLFW